jgi:sulfur-oxidizing protein SoxY
MTRIQRDQRQRQRRQILHASLSLGIGLSLTSIASKVNATELTPELAAVIKAFTRNAALTEGKVEFEIAELIDNGNTIPITITVDSPMTVANHVTEISIFNERNPQREVANFKLSKYSASAEVSTRIRLATSQKLVALARMNDGSCWSKTVEVIVTLAACLEEDA